MYDNTEIKIMEKIYINPGIHKRGLSNQLKLTMPSIDYALKKIDGLVKKQKSGNQIKYFLDYSKEAISPNLAAIEFSRFKKLPSKIRLALAGFLKDSETKPLIAAVFGSYASGDYTRSSDVDFLLVFQKIEDPDRIENLAKKISMGTNTKLNPVYLDYNEFREAFHDKTKSFFANLRKNKIILLGVELWRQLENEEA